jgi:cell division protein FtsZ
MTLHEVDEAANRIREEVDADANIIFGSTFDATMQGRMRVSVVSTGISAMAAQQPQPNYVTLDMNRPMQTGQPALSRSVAPPVGRVAMPAAAVSAPAAPIPAAPMVAAAPQVMAPVAPPAPVAVAPAPAPVAPPMPVMAEMPIPAQIVAAPVELAPAPAPVMAPAPVAPVAPAAPPIAATVAPAPVAPPPAAAPPRPLVDENDWRVSRPAARPAVRASEAITRPVAARGASESRAPNLFQRITGAFAAPKPAASAAAEPVAPRTVPENVVAVAPKPAPRPAPAQASINLDVTERAKPARDDDDLQIPAFLRRQAN